MAPQHLTEYRADSRVAPSQWETSLQSNAVSHWLGANLGSALLSMLPNQALPRQQAQAKTRCEWPHTSVNSWDIDSLVWNHGISNAWTLEILECCTKPSINIAIIFTKFSVVVSKSNHHSNDVIVTLHTVLCDTVLCVIFSLLYQVTEWLLNRLTHWPLREVVVILKLWYSNLFQEMISYQFLKQIWISILVISWIIFMKFLMLMLQNPSDDKPTLVQVTAWCHHASPQAMLAQIYVAISPQSGNGLTESDII